ncbi:L-threonylcarbamoyladenylate synthase [Thiomonas sp.]|jgi:L-threonylcarbamoyladenylate synthase|uniref:L-threonylcarbamoyladenylate synthase n=1 Tax=Thiomonas sp. TaxID=2047785 RepID=UPI00263279D5|nr:L-threonylcarbamoyladenylate synthase [Thiomonas sp.]
MTPSDLSTPDPAAIREAVRLLEAGRLVGLPTETVYGLAADAANDAAVRAIYAAKGRPADHPVIVHLHRRADPLRWAATLPPAARALIEAFWPGPLTLVLPRRAGVAAVCAAGQRTIALRCPDHAVAQAVLQQLHAGHGGLAAPSANRFGRISPTRAEHVRAELGDAVAMVLDGGECSIGIESTIVDCSVEVPRILRPGGLSADDLARVLGIEPQALHASSQAAEAPRVPGALAAHYAPRTALRLLEAAEIDAEWPRRAADVGVLAPRAAPVGAPPSARAHWLGLPDSPSGYAQGLYSALRALDALGLREIWVQSLPPQAPWDAVRDRLRRAAHGAGPDIA